MRWRAHICLTAAFVSLCVCVCLSPCRGGIQLPDHLRCECARPFAPAGAVPQPCSEPARSYSQDNAYKGATEGKVGGGYGGGGGGAGGGGGGGGNPNRRTGIDGMDRLRRAGGGATMRAG
jgi:hypothetical protein